MKKLTKKLTMTDSELNVQVAKYLLAAWQEDRSIEIEDVNDWVFGWAKADGFEGITEERIEAAVKKYQGAYRRAGELMQEMTPAFMQRNRMKKAPTPK